MLRYLCFFAVVLGVRSALAPFIKPCAPGDNACIHQSAQAAVPRMALGIPDLGVKSLDPMHLDLVNSDSNGLQLLFKDTTLTGLKDCVVETAKHDATKHKIWFTVRCNVTLKGDYSVNGRIIVLPIEGNGKYVINIRDIVIKTVSQLATVPGADGKQHWHIASWKHNYQVKTGADFQFQNLFNGNKVLAEPVEEFLNTSWREVMQEIAAPVIRAAVQSVIDGVDSLYKAVPVDELVQN